MHYNIKKNLWLRYSKKGAPACSHMKYGGLLQNNLLNKETEY